MTFMIDKTRSCPESKSAQALLEKYDRKSGTGEVPVAFFNEQRERDGFRIEKKDNGVDIYANSPISFNAAVGKLLRSDMEKESAIEMTFENEIRGTYFANHFYNYYHASPIEEVCDYLEVLALWGQSVVQLWLDMHHFSSLQDKDAQAMLGRMKAIFKKAKSLGMKTSLLKVANEYYAIGDHEALAQNSLDNGLYKGKLAGYYYTELCPSHIEGEKRLLASFRELLSAFSDVGLDYLCLWPYDQGGCTCEACYPWGGNGYYTLAKELSQNAREMFPTIKVIVSAWYFDHFTSGEWSLFVERAQREAPWFDGIMVNIGAPIPKEIKELNVPVLSFPDISMQGAVPWGGFGANPLPLTLKRQFDAARDFVNGGMVYSEGIFDDVNKILSLELFANPNADIDTILDDYCAFFFGKEYAKELSLLIKKLEPTLYRGRFDADGTRNDYPTDVQKELPTFRFRAPETLSEIEKFCTELDKRLPEEVRRDRRYRMLYIRAVGDYALYLAGGVPNETTDRIFGELEGIYYGENACYFVAPLTRKSALENKGHI